MALWCRWCGGRGCVACPSAPEPPPEPKPLLTVGLPEDDPEGWRVLREVFGREAMDKAFGPGGGGMPEVLANLAQERLRETE